MDEIQASLPDEFAGVLSPPYDLSGLPAMRMSPVQFGKRWSAMIRYGTSALAELPAHARGQLGYEDLLADPGAELTRLAAFLGVPAEQDWLDASAKLIAGDRGGTGRAGGGAGAGAGAGRAGTGRAGAARALDPDVAAQLREACAPGYEALAAFLASAPDPDVSRTPAEGA
jgi:hypothetical protein